MYKTWFCCYFHGIPSFLGSSKASAVQRLRAPARNVGVPRAFAQPCLTGQSTVTRCEHEHRCLCFWCLMEKHLEGDPYQIIKSSAQKCRRKWPSSSNHRFSTLVSFVCEALHHLCIPSCSRRTNFPANMYRHIRTDKFTTKQKWQTHTHTYTHAI